MARLVENPGLDDSVIIELAGLLSVEYGEADGLLRQIVDREAPSFDVRSAHGEGIARRLFAERCRAYLRGDLRPVDVCAAVGTLEWVYDFPHWIGNLWDACDWLDPGAMQEDVPFLTEEVERVAAAFDRDLS